MAIRNPSEEDSAARPQARGGGRVIRVGNYMIERRLGSGGQADVYLARDVILRRLVALKVLHRSSGSNSVRGVDEARLIATLDHPNILRVHHVEFSEGTWYMASEYIDGGNLELRVSRLGPLEPVRALRNAVAVADALEHAHRIGVLHRDLKPQNLLETRGGVIKLADFGLAGWQKEALESDGQKGAGTPQYLAPEIWTGAPASARADIYGLGGTLFFMLTGRPPFQARTVKELRTAHIKEPVTFPGLQPSVIVDVVSRCMAKNPNHRPASAKAVQEELAEAVAILTGDRRAKRRRPGVEPAPEAGYGHASRMAAHAAVMRLPTYAAALERVSQTLVSGAPVVVFSGAHPDAMARVLRAVPDSQRKLFMAARCVVGPSSPSLGSVCFEQLHLGVFPQPAWHERIIAELAPEVGSTPTIPSIMELELRRLLSSSETQDLIELGRRAEGKSTVFLATCDRKIAGPMLRDIEGSSYAFLVRHVELPEMGRLEAIEYVREWTRLATSERMLWTDDGIRYLLSLAAQNRGLDRLMHNAIMVTQSAGARVLTTWSVLAADAHQLYIESADGVLPEWRMAPRRWPSSEMLDTLIRLRSSGPAAQSPP